MAVHRSYSHIHIIFTYDDVTGHDPPVMDILFASLHHFSHALNDRS